MDLLKAMKRVQEASEEIKTLYGLNESELILMVQLFELCQRLGYSRTLSAKLMKACVYMLERTEDMKDFKL